MPEEYDSELKNPLGLNQAEIIAGLALEILKSAKNVINPVTKKPFRVKIGNETYLSLFIHRISSKRFSFGSRRWWNCWREKLSILSLR